MIDRKKRIYLLPIEPLDMRYSEQWLGWFRDEIVGSTYDLVIIHGKTLTREITNGAFLDICGTNYYKASQLQQCCEYIHHGAVESGDVFLALDGWFPGIEMLAYMRDGMKIDFKIAGCFHAGTYDDTDFISKLGMGVWGRDLENSWFHIFDAIFVATQYHKDLILHERVVGPERIHVTGFPIKRPDVKKGFTKEKIVVFPHRLTPDKQPELFHELRLKFSITHPNWSFICSQDEKRTKVDFYKLLRRSSIAISFAKHENWGIAMQEAVMLNCLPIVPNRLSYKEMYPDQFRFNSFDEAVELLYWMLDACDNETTEHYCNDFYKMRSTFIYNGEKAISNMIEVLRGL